MASDRRGSLWPACKQLPTMKESAAAAAAAAVVGGSEQLPLLRLYVFVSLTKGSAGTWMLGVKTHVGIYTGKKEESKKGMTPPPLKGSAGHGRDSQR